ncbi:hypothetical protein BG006_006638 [Podila minutissima]|uniref:Uncharacterized protein n=1 Tax=Podila minutissima TaxID=64525 RepID=A0A9P5VRF4_9FUNG|nr:hypothetical protein BG006_006638 [Podila minutissima]
MAPSVCDTSIHSAEAKGDLKLLACINLDPLLHSAPSTIPKDNGHKDDDITTTTDHAQTEKVDAPATLKPPSIKRAMRLSGIPMPSLPPIPILPTELEDFQSNYSNISSTIHKGVFSQQLDAYLASLRQDYRRQLQDYESLKAILKEDTYFSATVVAELDAQDEDPFTLDSFENLMRMHAAKGKDFILARVTTQDPNDESKHYHSYYSAHQINKVLFRTQPDEGLLHRMKARNPLNNMLVVGDVHYYIIKAEVVNAIKPLPVVRSSSSSILSHSSRMSRCSKLAAKAIASQSASARSSPILGTDCSLFSRGASPTPFDSESPVSMVPSVMAQSVMMADQEELHQRQKSNSPMMPPLSSPCSSIHINERMPDPGISSRRSSVSSTHSASGFQPGRPSRLRQAIQPEEIQDASPCLVVQPQELSSESENRQDQEFTSSSPPTSSSLVYLPTHSSPSQSPLFQSVMVVSGRHQRRRSNTVSSISSDKSVTSDISHVSHASQCSSALTDSSVGSPVLLSSSPVSSSSSSSSSTTTTSESQSVYQFKYLASDDDFLLRSTVRQLFKLNALEAWDAILFTISNNALRENQHDVIPTPNPLPLLPSLSLQQLAGGGVGGEGGGEEEVGTTSSLGTPRELPEIPTNATPGRPASELSHSGDSAIELSEHEGVGVGSELQVQTQTSSSSSLAASVGSTSANALPAMSSSAPATSGNNGLKKFRRALSKIFSIHS